MKIQELIESNVDSALKEKAKKSGKSITKLKSVYDQGLAAWRKSHPKGVSSAAWAMGRVNAYIEGRLDEAQSSLDDKQQELYSKWKKLINMSASSIEAFKKSQTEKGKKDPKQHPGLKQNKAASLGISSGTQSAEWIIKMKGTPVKEWTPEMWKWAGKQVSFVSRMLGNSGPMKDENGEPTRKLLSLKIWGHNPN